MASSPSSAAPHLHFRVRPAVNFLLSFFVALSVTMMLIPPLMRAAERFNFVDQPDARKLHAVAIPRVGGIAMITGAVLAMIMWRSDAQGLSAIVLAILVILFFGAWDDRADLDYRLKFFGQLMAALIVVYMGNVVIERVPFWDSLPKFISIPFTLFALLGITNAVNLSDGLDGLAGGTMLLSFGAIAALAYAAAGYGVAIIAVAAMGSILGFLHFNTHPARVFMGDAGSQFLGFTVGVLAIVLTQKVDTALSSVLPLYLLGLPILDTLMVIGQRTREGRSPFSPDNNHIHHKLLSLGFDPYEAVVIIYLAQASLVAGGYFFRYQSDMALLFAYCVFCTAVLAAYMQAAKTEWRFQGRAVGEMGTIISGRVKWLREEGRIANWVFNYISYAIWAYVLLAVVLSGRVSRDLAVIAVTLIVALLVTYLGRRGEPIHLVERAALYILGSFAVYLMQIPVGAPAWLTVSDKVFFALLIVAVLAAVIYCRKEEFDITPQDFLVLFVAFMLPFVPGEYFQSLEQRLVPIKLIIVFYGVELMLYRYHVGKGADALRIAIMASFAVVGLRGVI